jgi:hypothetical protein
MKISDPFMVHNKQIFIIPLRSHLIALDYTRNDEMMFHQISVFSFQFVMHHGWSFEKRPPMSAKLTDRSIWFARTG